MNCQWRGKIGLFFLSDGTGSQTGGTKSQKPSAKSCNQRSPAGIKVSVPNSRIATPSERNHHHDIATNRRVIDDQLFAHFLTFSVYRRRWLFDLDHPKRILLGVLNQELESFDAKCIGFVVMPDHIPPLIWFSKTGLLSEIMHCWKRKSSFHIRNWYREEAAHYFSETGEGEQFWQPNYYSFEIYSVAKLEEKLQYMHQNPVRAGLVRLATDWKWSSAQWYEWQTSVGVPIRWVD